MILIENVVNHPVLVGITLHIRSYICCLVPQLSVLESSNDSSNEGDCVLLQSDYRTAPCSLLLSLVVLEARFG